MYDTFCRQDWFEIKYQSVWADKEAEKHASDVLISVPLILAHQRLLAPVLKLQPLTESACVQKAFEEQMKPLTEQIEKLTGIPIPDFGPLDDWTALRNVETARRERRAAGRLPVGFM